MGNQMDLGNTAGKRAKTTSLWKILLASIAVPILVLAFAEGPPSEHTGGFGEGNCTECH